MLLLEEAGVDIFVKIFTPALFILEVGSISCSLKS
jgi:hypothetical protein